MTILFLNLTALTLYFVRQDERAGGIYNGVMAFSQNMGLVVCFFVTYLTCVYKYQLKLSALYKKLLFTVALSSVILVLLTMTRGVWLAAIVGISVSAFFIPKRVFAYTLAGIIILFSSVTYFSSTFKDRIYSRTDGSQTSNSQRKNLWKANTSIFLDYPIIGAGYSLNNSRLTEYYKKLNIQDDGFRSHAHNQYLHFAAGTGILGLLFYLFFIGSIFKDALKGYLQSSDNHTKSIYLSLLSSFISFLIAGLTESNFSISKNRLLFLFLCSFIISIGIKSKMVKNS
jgi:O-antigen ligase